MALTREFRLEVTIGLLSRDDMGFGEYTQRSADVEDPGVKTVRVLLWLRLRLARRGYERRGKKKRRERFDDNSAVFSSGEKEVEAGDCRSRIED